MEKRRWVYLCALAVLTLRALAADPFSFEQVREQARALAAKPYQAPVTSIPKPLQDLNYTQYGAIAFKQGAALWAGERLPFEVEFFLPGSIHKQQVQISEVSKAGVRPVPFRPEAFVLGDQKVELPPSLGYAGFRLVRPAPHRAEVAAFLDASYFRMVNLGGAFGASARGLAIDTALIGKEEFPIFREFWLLKPRPSDAAMTLWAVLDSPRVAGALEFVIRPGTDTVTRTRAAFFPRSEVKEFGIAPLTSMFWYDENSHPPKRDFRPEVHDSDGLLLHTGQGKWLWRPLDNGRMVRVNAYQDVDPKGFGLMQRDRDFRQYQDTVARFEARPSVWVEPIGKWGQGDVELVQLPSDSEYEDNTVAFWVPKAAPKPGQSVELAYNLHWLTNELSAPSLAKVQATRIGQVPGQPPGLRFVVDFDGPGASGIPSHDEITAQVRCSDGAKLTHQHVEKNEVNGTWRVVVEISAPNKAVDLQAVLEREKQPASETWIYTYQP